MIKKILTISLAIIVLVCIGIGLFIYSSVNKDIDEQFSGVCVDVPLPGSGEDLQIDRERQYAYVSTYDRLTVAQGGQAEPGTIFRLDLGKSETLIEKALIDGPDLHPHGISIFITDEGDRHLYVINHPKDRSTGQEMIEHYVEVSPGEFKHLESFSDDLITRGNDMVAVGARKFYVAQDVERGSGETLTQLIYFDGSEFRSVADDIESAGGINVSADGEKLYIAETGANRIRVAQRNLDGSIETIKNIDIGSAPDNIDIAEDGSLWVGTHSNVIALAMHFIMGIDAPTEILRIDASQDNPKIEEIYINRGKEISAGSGGATLGKKLMIGSITASKVLLCEME